MIKTHKPRGHFWVGASVFQRSQEIRKITIEDCTPPEDEEVLYPDSEEDLSTSERSAKRRCIEQLADDFLNGKPLTIQSARPHYQSLKVAIEYNERSRTGKQYALQVTRERNVDEAAIWEDVDELATDSVRTKAAKRSGSSGRKTASGKQTRAEPRVQAVDKEQASSACRQVRHRNVKLTLAPSTAARKQAAALRTRGLRRAATEAPAIIEMIDESTPESGVHSDPSTMARPRYFRNRKPPSTEWLLRQNTALYELKADESFDELTRSPMDSTPSRPSQRPKAEFLSVPGAEIHDYKGVSEPCSTDDLAKSQGQGLQRAVAIPEAVQEDSSNDHSINQSPPRQADTEASISHCSIKQSPRRQAVNHDVSRRTSPDTSDQSQEVTGLDATGQAMSRPAYTALASSDENGTPFMFRKRRTRSNPNGEPAISNAIQPKAKRRGREASKLSAKPSASFNDGPAAPAAAAPVLDMSISHDSSFGMRLNMALVDEHINAILPTETSPDGRTSSVRKALRREMQDAGADISFAEGELHSSQGDVTAKQHQDNNIKAPAGSKGDREDLYEPARAANAAAMTQWPGTQVALHQAQRDLYPSPAKCRHVDGHAENMTPDRSHSPPASAPPTNPPIRQPLRELSQDQQLPSTQVLMGAWSPWSAVKKPKTGTASIAAPSPSAPLMGIGKAAKSSRLSIIDSEPATSFNMGFDRRRSSLRFSVTSEGWSTPKMQFRVTKSASQEAGQSFEEKSGGNTLLESSSAQQNWPHRSNDSPTRGNDLLLPEPSLTSILKDHLGPGESQAAFMGTKFRHQCFQGRSDSR